MFYPSSNLLSESKSVEFKRIKHRYSTPLRIVYISEAFRHSRSILQKTLPDDIIRIIYGYTTVRIQYEKEESEELCLELSHGHCSRAVEGNFLVAIAYVCVCRNPGFIMFVIGFILVILITST